MEKKVRLVTLKVINAEDTNIDVEYFNKVWKRWTNSSFCEGKMLGIDPIHNKADDPWTETTIILSAVEEMIADGEWRLANEYNDDPDTRYYTRDKNETDKQKELLAALVEVYDLGADVKVQF